jgi:hypothetical protein
MFTTEGRGTGGSTSSCTLRGTGVVGAAKIRTRAAPSRVAVDGGAARYFFRHSAVVCVVECGWLVQEPAGWAPSLALPFPSSLESSVVPLFFCPALVAEAEDEADATSMSLALMSAGWYR